MAGEQLGVFIRHLKRMVGPSEGGGLTDAQLLERWVGGRDEAAFEVILWRHGPMVLGVCRRLLTDAHDVDDAFQATFLTLVRRAGTIRTGAALAGWLYQVAYRVALRARARRKQRAAREEAGVEWLGGEDKTDLVWRDLRPVLDEEIHRLPDKYRAAFVLCYLQGQTNEEAARTLGCPLGTVLSRLAWARQRLRQRLTRRGVTVSAALLTTALAQHAAAATVAAPLVLTTLTAALAYAAGSAAAGTVPASAAALTEGVVRSMFLGKLKIAAVMFLALALLGGAGAWAFHSGPVPDGPGADDLSPAALLPEGDARLAAPAENTPPVGAAAADEKGERRLVEVASPREGVVTLVGTLVKEGDRIPAGREIRTLKGGGGQRDYYGLKIGDTVEAKQVLAQLDDRLARDEVAIKEAKVLAAEADVRAAEATKREAIRRYERAQELAKRNAVSEEDLQAARVTAERYGAEHVSRAQFVQVARRELNQAQTILEMHTLRSPARGVITRIYKHPGEAVKALEPVFQLRLAERGK